MMTSYYRIYLWVNRSIAVTFGVWLFKYHTVRCSCSYVHTVIGMRLMYHTTSFLAGCLCHQLSVCGTIVSLAVFVPSFVTCCPILSQHHFGNFGPLSPFDAWYFCPFLSHAHSKELFPCHTFLFLQPHSIDCCCCYSLYLHPLPDLAGNVGVVWRLMR